MDLRIIAGGAGDAAANMEFDRRLIEEVSEEPTHAVLRWYAWEPPAFSLGYGQKPEEVFDGEKLARSGVAWAKRPTGGGLVYHDGDVSYSFTLPRENPWGVSSSRDLYRLVSGAWMEGLGRLGIPARAPERVPPASEVSRTMRQLCLAFHSPGDILVYGRKIGGSAQRRLRKVWHQQGFFLLRPASPPDCFRDPVMEPMMHRGSADLLSVGHQVDARLFVGQLTEAMVEVFQGMRREVVR